jgi:methionyl-tRNA formyltransferase
MKIIYMGSPKEAIFPLSALLETTKHQVIAVISQEPKLKGRGQKKAPEDPPLARFAKNQGLTVLQPAKASHPDFVEILRQLSPDVVITCAYGQILSEAFLAVAKRATINIHPSKIPELRGATPIQSALLEGKTTTALTILFTVKALDAGAIIRQKETPIFPTEKAGDLMERLFKESGPLLLEALKDLDNDKFQGTPQNEAQVSFCRKIQKEDGNILWDLSANVIYNRFRAYHPWPGSYTFFDKKRILIQDMFYDHGLECPSPKNPGETFFLDHKIFVQTGNGIIGISSLKMEGRNEQSAQEFWNGCRGKNLRDDNGFCFISTSN